MKLQLWKRQLKEAEDRLQKAEELRDDAQRQQRVAEEIAPRVDALSASLRRLHTENHVGPLIDFILRGGE